MKVENNHVVEMNYTLKDDRGVVIDSSEGKSSLSYIQGKKNLVPGLEKEILGKTVGDKFSVSINPEDGYGQVDSKLLVTFPQEEIVSQVGKAELGMQFQVEGPDGNPMIMTLIKIENGEVILDGNHPLAGQNLNFDIEIVSLRDATKEELDRGSIEPVSTCSTGCC